MRWTVIQTAFLGDVVLTLPLLNAIVEQWHDSEIQFIARPEAANVIETAPGIADVVIYDKRGNDSAFGGWWRIKNRIQNFHPEIVLCPHRSARSVLLAGFSGANKRIGYHTAAPVPGLTTRVPYRGNTHETARLLDLLQPLNGKQGTPTLPRLQLTEHDRAVAENSVGTHERTVAIAPGAVWNTKRYPVERFSEAAKTLSESGFSIVTIGGNADIGLCEFVATSSGGISLAGKLSPRESAAVISRCQLLITNDSAPLHLAQAVGTPTLAIFGATIPEFGFGPQGQYDRVLGIDISCRPCAIHGGPKCPQKHFRCMLDLQPELVAKTAIDMLL